MRVLVTGGSDGAGQAAVRALLARGHIVRLFGPKATDDARQWPYRVEAVCGDVSNADEVRGCAAGCDAVLHLAGIVTESSPDVTFARVNALATRHVVSEAARSNVPR